MWKYLPVGNDQSYSSAPCTCMIELACYLELCYTAPAWSQPGAVHVLWKRLSAESKTNISQFINSSFNSKSLWLLPRSRLSQSFPTKVIPHSSEECCLEVNTTCSSVGAAPQQLRVNLLWKPACIYNILTAGDWRYRTTAALPSHSLSVIIVSAAAGCCLSPSFIFR